jgi:uncharacterized protein YabE (DUF348 family)
VKSNLKIALLIGLPLIGVLAGYLLMGRQITVTVDGEQRDITTHALTVRGALRSAGYEPGKLDRIDPSENTWLTGIGEIIIRRGYPLQVWNDATRKLIPVDALFNTPVEVLVAAGITPVTGDEGRINGLPVSMNDPLPTAGRIVLQYIPSVRMTVDQNGQQVVIRTTAPTVGRALWDEGITVHGGDALNLPFTSAPDETTTTNISNAISLVISVDDRDITTFATAATVGEALAMAGVALQDLDFSNPAETEPLPADGRIKVVRVKEDIISEQQTISYSTETITDETLESGETQVVTAGEFGVQLVRVKVRYENGKEVSRETLETVILQEPVNEVKAIGTNLSLSTIDTPYGTLSYYKAITVTATSYSPCNSGIDGCSYSTAMGTTVQKGVLAVNSSWYKILKGTKIYVPGYGIGTVQDTGSYPYSSYWIDLGYTDAEFASAGTLTYPSITVYLLGPFAEGTSLVLP